MDLNRVQDLKEYILTRRKRIIRRPIGRNDKRHIAKIVNYSHLSGDMQSDIKNVFKTPGM